MTLSIHQLDTGGPTLACAMVGAASPAPLVFLHGLGDSAIMTFEPIARHPALRGRGAILIDLPGFGYGSAPANWSARMEDHAAAVATLLDTLDVSESTIVGHSMGASLALLVARERQQRISRLILAEPLLVPDQSQLAKAIARRPEASFVEHGYATLVTATRRQASRGERAAERFLEPLRMADPAILHRSAVSLLQDRTPSFLDLLGTLRVPRTLLIGERTVTDPALVPEEVAVMTIPDAGHSMMSENRDGFAAAVKMAMGEEIREEGDQQARGR